MKNLKKRMMALVLCLGLVVSITASINAANNTRGAVYDGDKNHYYILNASGVESAAPMGHKTIFAYELDSGNQQIILYFTEETVIMGPTTYIGHISSFEFDGTDYYTPGVVTNPISGSSAVILGTAKIPYSKYNSSLSLIDPTDIANPDNLINLKIEMKKADGTPVPHIDIKAKVYVPGK